MAGYTTIKIRRGNDAELPPLQEGELGYSLDSYTLYSGTDGTRYGVRTIGAFIRDTCAVVIRDKVQLSGLQTVDGIELKAGDRVLCVAQDLNDDEVDGAKESGRFATKLGGSWTKCGVYVVSEGSWGQARDFGCLRQYSPYMLVPVKYGPYAGIWAIILARTSSGAVDKAYWSQVADSFESFTVTDTDGTTVTVEKNDNITFISQLSPSFTPSNGDNVIDASEIAPATLTVVTDEKDPYGHKYTYTLDAAKREHCHDNRYVNITGDTMTGPLILSRDPVEDKEAATKFYVDEHDQQTLEAAQEYAKTYADTNKVHAVNGDDFIVATTTQNGEQKTVTLALRTTTAENDAEATTKVSRADHLHDGRYLQLTGGTMTGQITLPDGTPNDNQAVQKSYVDIAIQQVNNTISGMVSDIATEDDGGININPSADSPQTKIITAKLLAKSDENGQTDNLARADHLHSQYLDTTKTDSTEIMGPLILSATLSDTSNVNQAVTKAYVDEKMQEGQAVFAGEGPGLVPGKDPTVDEENKRKYALTMSGEWVTPIEPIYDGTNYPGLVPVAPDSIPEGADYTMYFLNMNGDWTEAKIDDGKLSDILA